MGNTQLINVALNTLTRRKFELAMDGTNIAEGIRIVREETQNIRCMLDLMMEQPGMAEKLIAKRLSLDAQARRANEPSVADARKKRSTSKRSPNLLVGRAPVVDTLKVEAERRDAKRTSRRAPKIILRPTTSETTTAGNDL